MGTSDFQDISLKSGPVALVNFSTESLLESVDLEYLDHLGANHHEAASSINNDSRMDGH